MASFTWRSEIPVPAEDVFAWHERPGAFQRLVPPWQTVEIRHREGGIRDGATVVLRVKVGPVWQRWVVEHRDYVEGRRFCDEQIEGPFARWTHTHEMIPRDEQSSVLEDHIEYDLPLQRVGEWFGTPFVERQLRRLFRYRHDVTRNDLLAHRRAALHPLRVLVTGSSGLIGSSLIPFLTTGGHSVSRLVRSGSAAGPASICWDPRSGIPEEDRLEGFDAVVHLAGENVAKAWSSEQKRRIHDSRVEGTWALAEALARRKRKPRAMVCASAVGIYGDRGDERLDESSSPGEGFLAGVCREWEAAARPAVDAGIRVVHLRFGLVLSPATGGLRQLLPLFKVGLGGRLGSGQQYIAWISIDDAVDVLCHAIASPDLHGAVNAVAPDPLTNSEFVSELARVLRRPVGPAIPASLLRLWYGDMADSLLLSSKRVYPARLHDSGFTWRHPDLETALCHVLGLNPPRSRPTSEEP